MSGFKRIRSLGDLEVIAGCCSHVLTLFSGGLDSTFVLSQLARKNVKVTALTVDVGDDLELAELKRLASHFGADLCVVDARELFVHDAVLPAICAQAKYLGIYPISSSLSRPIIAKVAVETAMRLKCDAIVHTANQSQNSLRRLNGALDQLGYAGYFGSPYEYSAISRGEKISQLGLEGLKSFEARGISGDANLWSREFESGSLDNPEKFEVPVHLYRWTAPPSCPPVPREMKIEFVAGRPTSLDDQQLSPVDLIARLNLEAGAFGIGRYAGLEHLEQGEKVLEVREAPAASVLMAAFRHLETAVLDAELMREKLSMEQLWVREAIEGRWYGALRTAADGFISDIGERISGTVTFQLRPGAFDLCSIRARAPRYLVDRDTWEASATRIRGSRELVLDDGAIAISA